MAFGHVGSLQDGPVVFWVGVLAGFLFWQAVSGGRGWESVWILVDGFGVCGAFDSRGVYSFACGARTVAFGLLKFVWALQLVVVFLHMVYGSSRGDEFTAINFNMRSRCCQAMKSF